jgi:hypothetical protein
MAAQVLAGLLRLVSEGAYIFEKEKERYKWQINNQQVNKLLGQF